MYKEHIYQEAAGQWKASSKHKERRVKQRKWRWDKWGAPSYSVTAVLPAQPSQRHILHVSTSHASLLLKSLSSLSCCPSLSAFSLSPLPAWPQCGPVSPMSRNNHPCTEKHMCPSTRLKEGKMERMKEKRIPLKERGRRMETEANRRESERGHKFPSNSK